MECRRCKDKAGVSDPFCVSRTLPLYKLDSCRCPCSERSWQTNPSDTNQAQRREETRSRPQTNLSGREGKDVYLSNMNNMSSPPQVRPQQMRAEVDERQRTETVLVKQPGGLILQFCPHPAIRSLAMTSSSIFIAWYGDVSI